MVCLHRGPERMTIERALMGTTDATGGGLYVEDVFSTYLYTGTGAAQTINNGIDLDGEGGMIWTKNRGTVSYPANCLFDTNRGAGNLLISNSTYAQSPGMPQSFLSNGFSLGAAGYTNGLNTYASWTFRKAPKFFDVVTYTGNGSNQTIAHNLGSAPGMVIVKGINNVNSWFVYHRSIGNTGAVFLSDTSPTATSSVYWSNTSPTSTNFTVGTSSGVNASGVTYVAYLFAHDAGGFGAAGTDSIVSCGSFTTDGSGNVPNVTLGWEPQYLLCKNKTSSQDWFLLDTMRGWSVSGQGNGLSPNKTNAELDYFSGTDYFHPTATGFSGGSQPNFFGANQTIIYLAIRRPMKTPTSGASVFAPTASSATAGTKITNGFASDMQMVGYRGGDLMNFGVFDRLRGVSTITETQIANGLRTAQTAAEYTATNLYANTLFWDNTGFQIDSYTGGGSTVRFNFQRAPGFFDVVCYTGNNTSNRQIKHNLGVSPEMMIVKKRDSTVANGSWSVWQKDLGILNPTTNYGLYLDTTNAKFGSGEFGAATPTSAYFIVENSLYSNYNGSGYVVYLFASCPGVSKVGSYTGNGSSQTINCGFAAGARFVLVKRTDSTGDWWVWDTARGITSTNDPHLSLNTTAAEVTTDDSINPDSTGFIVNQVSATNINVSSASYIFLAIS